MRSVSPDKHQRLKAFFLPDLCNTRAVLVLLVVSEALVLALTLVETGLTHFSLPRFAVVSFFVQWVCLLSVALLCQLRMPLSALPVRTASLVAMMIMLLVSLLVSIVGEGLWPENIGQIDWLWVARNMMITAIFGAMALRYFYVQSQWRLKTQAELKARLAALQANIRPHFFFNTLNTVASLIAVDPDKAETLLLDLAQLFRVVLKNDDSPILLAQEVALGQRYLAIEQIRLGGRLQVQWQLPNDLPQIFVPSLLLQPLLENAVYHGIQPSIEPGYIRVSLQEDHEGWWLVVANSVSEHRSEAGHGMAHNNIRARLEALDAHAQLHIEHHETYYQARILLPHRLENVS